MPVPFFSTQLMETLKPKTVLIIFPRAPVHCSEKFGGSLARPDPDIVITSLVVEI